MSFSESMFPVGFNQKAVKEELFLKGNHQILSRNQCGKVPEDSRRLSTEGDHMSLTCGATPPHCQAAHALVGPLVSHVATSVLHRLLRCISAVISSRFDPKAQD